MIPSSKRVNFIILGAMKCGTTTLSHILKIHPDICFSQPKETNFFSKNVDWKEKLNIYHSYFKENRQLWGEGSTGYSKPISYKQSLWNSIYEYNPEMKFIYIVRNPLDRSISHYSHNFIRNRTTSNIDKLVMKQNFLKVSCYFKQVSPYVQKFGASQVLLLDFDDLISAKQQVAKNMFDFLEIESTNFPYENIQNLHANNSENSSLKSKLRRVSLGRKTMEEKPQLLPETKQKIINYLRNDIESLEKLFNKDFSKWLIL
ncbi:MAG: sulfotransferase domain-containing protein [Cytophagales bacterium]|nr:sulfotransferase domain-containing protein [Cytophagales bacterium]